MGVIIALLFIIFCLWALRRLLGRIFNTRGHRYRQMLKYREYDMALLEQMYVTRRRRR